jgi:transposase
LEQRQPIDLLPDRETSTVATWLEAHPGIEIVTRDRASAYADAISKGAPQATQVADRWHLLCNCREAVERLMERHQSVLRRIKVISPTNSVTSKQATKPRRCTSARQTFSALRRAERLQRYQEIKSLSAGGMSQRAIALKLHIHRQTARRYLLADEFPEHASRAIEPNELTPFKDYLLQRWQAGCQNGVQLLREIRQQGYRGSKTRVYYWTVKQRSRSDARVARPTPITTTKPLSARKASWLLVRVPANLKVEEQELLKQMLEQGQWLTDAYDLTQKFGTMIRERRADELTGWLRDAKSSDLTELKNFAIGLERDLNAVRAGLSLAWSNGPTEGHVNRLKLIKRQMYGRANFDLLRRRVLDGY